MTVPDSVRDDLYITQLADKLLSLRLIIGVCKLCFLRIEEIHRARIVL